MPPRGRGRPVSRRSFLAGAMLAGVATPALSSSCRPAASLSRTAWRW